MRLPALALCLLASVAAAQPAPEALLAAWADGQAAADVGTVVLAERVDRVIEGPRGGVEVALSGTVRYPRDGRPERDVETVTVDGREATGERGGAVRRRLGRAFGPAGRDVAAPPPLPLGALARLAPDGPARADRVGDVEAWRVALRPARGRGRRVEAWFSRTADPRLLRTRTEARRRGARLVRETDYARGGGLDLPAEVRATATVRQRRRLRDYVVTVRSRARYRAVRVERGGR